jgi:hypothetical protein
VWPRQTPGGHTSQAEAVVEEAKQLAEVAEEVLEELKEMDSEAEHA